MNIALINPFNQQKLSVQKDLLTDHQNNHFPKIRGAYRFVESDNYTQSFGYQWNKFQKTQIDRFSPSPQSRDRFFAVTGWEPESLAGKNMLEVGSGAGRFTHVVLEHTQANLYSVDYSDAVEANHQNNGHYGERLNLFQASIYAMPFAPKSFDRVFCFGVLQHTPDFKKSVQSLIEMVKPGGELVVDFYPIRGWWTKIHAKYLLRPWTRRLNHERLLYLIDRHADRLIKLYDRIDRLKIAKFVNRFIPVCDIKNTLPPDLSPEQRREWVVLDTFDMFSPRYDQPQRLSRVKKWFEAYGMQQVQADYVQFGHGQRVARVKGVK
ncbi:MAG: class I SAM-dependent methyltransferase [Bacteroidia bacterium]|nr:class I SAM-dependent methyltransferase [Bacteroidia bacterium]